MTKVLFVSHTLDSAAGGAERVLLDILKRIDREAFEVGIAVGRDATGVPVEFKQLGIPIEVLAMLPMDAPRGLAGALKVGSRLLSLATSLFFILRRDRPDMIHVNSIFALHFALPACLLTGTKLIYHEHGLPESRKGSIWSIAYRQLIQRVTHTAAITDAVRAEVIGSGVPAERVTTVHNGIDPGEGRAASEVSVTAASRSSFSIVQIANFLDWKGQDTLLQALPRLRAKVPEARVTFYGKSKDLEYEARLREIIAALDLSECVEFGGFRDDLPDILPTYDCLVLASKAEPFGLVLLEAMRAGIPIVATNSGGAPEIVSNEENGLLFEPEDSDGLADALARIALDSAFSADLVKEGHRVMRTSFSFAQQVEKLEAIFRAHR